MRISIAIVTAAALSTAALAQVGTDPAENKVPAELAPHVKSPQTEPQSTSPIPTDDAPTPTTGNVPTDAPSPMATATPRPTTIPR